MRRRIATHESISDCTDRLYRYMDEHEGELILHGQPRALYDEELWAELVEAQHRLRDVERRVLAALVDEPLDSVEIELGRKLSRMVAGIEPYDAAECSRIEAALREHAKTAERKS